MIQGSDNNWVVVKLLSVEGKFVKAHEFGQQDEFVEELKLNLDESAMVDRIKKVWAGILKIEIEDDTDFFGAGAGSMDVVRLIEEVREETGLTLTNEEVFMATQFKDFVKTLVVVSRGGGGKKAQGNKTSSEYDISMFHSSLRKEEDVR